MYCRFSWRTVDFNFRQNFLVELTLALELEESMLEMHVMITWCYYAHNNCARSLSVNHKCLVFFSCFVASVLFESFLSSVYSRCKKTGLDNMGKTSELLPLLKTGNSDAARRLILKLKKSGRCISYTCGGWYNILFVSKARRKPWPKNWTYPTTMGECVTGIPGNEAVYTCSTPSLQANCHPFLCCTELRWVFTRLSWVWSLNWSGWQ